MIALSATLLCCQAAVAGAQSIVLQLHPHAGDTIRVSMEQQSELTGVRHGKEGDARTSLNSLTQVFSRVVIEDISARGATVTTIADSALASSTDPRTGARRGDPQRLPTPPRVRFIVTPSGTVEMLESSGRREEGELAALMPAALPKGKVSVGSTWTREMPIPGTLGGAAAGVLRATFRFDSLGDDGRLAYVSMDGALQPDSVGRVVGRPSLESGTVNGVMILDRRSGWMAESRFTILATAAMAARAGAEGAMRFQMKVTQRMRATLGKR